MSKSRIVKKSPQIRTILVVGSNAKYYERIVARRIMTARQKRFLEGFLEALDANIPNFRVPVYDPSINNTDETITFVPGAKPAIGYSYEELKEIAQKNNLKLGSKNQYHLFVATMILRLMDEEGFSEDEAWKEMCDCSKLSYSEYNKLKMTGSYPVAGKYDLGMTLKVLEPVSDSEECWIAGTCHMYHHLNGETIASIYTERTTCIGSGFGYASSVGWFVFDENDERTLNFHNIENKSHRVSTKYETISVYRSRSVKYERLIKFDTTFKPYKDFQEMLKYVMGLDMPSFKVPVYFPTLDENGLLQFINMPGLPEHKKPLRGLSYTQCKDLAKKSGVRLGTRNQYILFIATLILNLIDSGKSDEEAWDIMYNYLSKADDRLFECIRGNQYKILANDIEDDTYYLNAGGRFFANGNANIIWYMSLDESPNSCSNKEIGWFVF